MLRNRHQDQLVSIARFSPRKETAIRAIVCRSPRAIPRLREGDESSNPRALAFFSSFVFPLVLERVSLRPSSSLLQIKGRLRSPDTRLGNNDSSCRSSFRSTIARLIDSTKNVKNEKTKRRFSPMFFLHSF